ncbi:VCBS repeat-containing protein [Winogradskyella echinorum]|uniref:VCBS repeat-containing protein n=1 Tax=Winogradskyella echinorum TaxID=538189 RepID=A0ABR6Y1F8_9FLAO|nr:FG-GAP-like repeat-containing protein [Winogradskyella echinorum]MBC3846582.1 VCBS repeat-containing protein [Winogradskyella echinorum]MBC5750930.1 VCBS repeat-containing protein [Winogradskyella echinorum]
MVNKKLILFITVVIAAIAVLYYNESQIDASNYSDYELLAVADHEKLTSGSYTLQPIRENSSIATFKRHEKAINSHTTNRSALMDPAISAEAIAKFLNGNLPTTTPSGNTGIPALLSQTGAFSNLSILTPNPGLIPYDMIEPFWSDGAAKKRWMAIPNDGTYDTADEQITFSNDEAWDFPRGSVLIKHFEVGGQRLETRFEVKGDDDVYYYLTYKWNSAQTDATLLDDAVDEDVVVNGVTQSWHYPSRNECASCHFPQNGSVLGPKTRHLNKAITYPSSGITMNQLVNFSELGLITETITDTNVSNYPAVAAKDDLSASLEDRARSYLDVNCASCHNPNVDNVAMFDARYSTPSANQNIIYGPVVYDEGLTDPKVIIPQDVANSMAHFRMNSTQTGIEMPPIAKDVVDTAGVQLIEDWINSLTPATSSPPEALFSASTVNGPAPLSVNFDASASIDADNDPLTYSWDFGDGNTASGVTTSHIFTTSAEFTVTLTVSDGEFSDIATTIIAVNNSNPGGNTMSFTDGTSLLGQDNFSGLPMGVIDMNGDGKDDIVQFNNARQLRIQYQNEAGQPFTSHDHGTVSNSNQWGTAIADFDHNGFNDIMSGGAYDNLKIVKNNNGNDSYSQSTQPNSILFLQGANFADINNDGWADIFACHDDAESRAYQNNQDGTLSYNHNLIRTFTTPSSDNSGNYASMWMDYDNDGDLDLYISKCRGGVNDPTDPRRINMLWQNDGDNNFTEVAEQANLKIGAQTWLSDFGDIDNDGDLDAIIINHFTGPNLMRNNGNGTFTEITTGSGLLPTLDSSNFYGIQGFFKDFNNDGFIDLMVSGDNHYIFYNNGDGTFQNAPNPFNSNQIQSFSVGDINHDGFLDIYAGYANGLNSPSSTKDRIWLNDGNSNNYINIQLEGTVSNINGIGARVELYGTWGKQIRDVRSGEGYGLVNTFTQHFGIGVNTQIEKVVVRWPSGVVDEILNPEINQFLKIIETIPEPSCNDGIQNGDETGVDCGGSCPDECPPPPTCTDVMVSITFDNYPQETSWSIQDSAGVTVASGGTYGSEPDGSTITIEECLPEGCYDFIISDTYGDGICCEYGNGSYTVTANGLTVASGASFENSETTNFCLEELPCAGVDLTVIEVDFENGSGTDWTTSGTASTGTFVIANPTAQTSGVLTQPEDDHSEVGTNAFFTATNTTAGVNDIDGGVSIATSPVYTITDDSNLSIWYFFGQRDAGGDSGDFFLLEYSIDGGTNYTTLASYGDETVEAQWTEATAQIPANSSLVIRVSAADGSSAGDIVEAGIDDLVVTKICVEPILYTFNDNVWSPEDPNNISNSNDEIVIESGEAVISMNTSINTISVEAGAALTVNSGITLSANTTTLKSTSVLYSSLIVDGTIEGEVKYERFVNASSGGNDLISPPLSGQTWEDFLALDTNATDLLNNGSINPTTYAFGPFDKTVDNYINYTNSQSDLDNINLVSGKGYRAATESGTNLTFEGTVPTYSISINILDTGAQFPDWNLIGNPYPSYLDMDLFLNFVLLDNGVDPVVRNMDIFENISGIYGYAGNGVENKWDVITLANASEKLMAPGQGFFVAANEAYVNDYDVIFDPSMRAKNGADDFIAGRSSNNLTFFKLNIGASNSNYSTEFYFNNHASKGLDHGYDGKILGNVAPNFALYSLLVEDNTGLPIALQALNPTDLVNTIIPLGVNSNQGEQITFSISETTLPRNVEVYLEDNVTNTVTLLNSGDYTFTPNTDLNGSGRFYLRVTSSTLSVGQNELDYIQIYTTTSPKSLVIKGQLNAGSRVSLHDIQGRLVLNETLNHLKLSNTIDISRLGTGVYFVKVFNNYHSKTQKIIVN